jgi:hypothetical protein
VLGDLGGVLLLLGLFVLLILASRRPDKCGSWKERGQSGGYMCKRIKLCMDWG